MGTSLPIRSWGSQPPSRYMRSIRSGSAPMISVFARVKGRYVLDFTRFKIFRIHTERFGLDAQVNVLDTKITLRSGNSAANAMAAFRMRWSGLLSPKIRQASRSLSTTFSRTTLIFPLVAALEGNPVARIVAYPILVEGADELARLEVFAVVAFFEGIQLFQYADGEGYVVVVETSYCAGCSKITEVSRTKIFDRCGFAFLAISAVLFSANKVSVLKKAAGKGVSERFQQILNRRPNGDLSLGSYLPIKFRFFFHAKVR